MLAGVSFSGAQGVSLTPGVRDSIRVKPGGVVTTALTVANRSTRQQTYDTRLVLPSGWRAVTHEAPFALQPNESDVRLVGVAVASQMPAGHYEVRYHVTDRSTPQNEAVTVLRVEVLTVRAVELQLVEFPRFVLAGKDYRAEFILTSKSNSPERVRLSVRSILDFPMRLDSSAVLLTPRETRSITISVKTDASLSSKQLHNLELYAHIVGDSSASTKASSYVEIIPHVTQTEERYHELPVYISLRGIGMESQSKFQIQAGGTGSFSETGNDQIDFLFRGPNTQQVSILGQQDEYRVSYKRRGLELYLGDGSYYLTPLTELGRYGTGAGGKVSVGDFTLKGYYNETRWYSPAQKQFGGAVSYALAERTEVGVHYLNKREAASGGLDGDIATLRGLIEAWDPARLDLEYALGSAKGTRGDAYSLRVNGSQQWLHYDLRYVHADPKYPGYYRDINFASASVNATLWGQARLEAYVRKEERNLRRDSTLFYAPQDQFVQVGAGYSNYISFYYRRNQQEDLLPGSKYRRVEDVAQLQLGYSFPGVDLFANADFGTTHDKLANKNFPSKRYALFSTIRPTPNQSFNTSLEYTEDQNLLTGETQQRYSAGLNLWLTFGNSTHAQVSGYTSKSTGSVNQRYSTVELTVEQQMLSNHKLVLRGRQNFITPSFGTKERAYAVEYLIPIGIPVKRLTTTGSLRGRVVDEAGRGLENVLVNAGAEAAVTDREGYFVFASLKPQRQYFIIDKATIGLDRITTQPMPMEVSVRGGEEERLDIRVVRSARLTGTVTTYNFDEASPVDSAQKVVAAGGQPGMVVELTSGGESHRRVSDNTGTFSFADLRPGAWTLRVIGGELPQYHYVERESYDVIVAPGASEQMSIRILPRRRAIQILQQGAVLQTGKPATAVAPPPPPPTVQPEEPCLIVYRKDKGGYVLQVSSWVNEAKAKEQASVAEAFTGMSGFVERTTVPTLGIRYRVYVGAFKTRAEAESICNKMQAGE